MARTLAEFKAQMESKKAAAEAPAAPAPATTSAPSALAPKPVTTASKSAAPPAPPVTRTVEPVKAKREETAPKVEPIEPPKVEAPPTPKLVIPPDIMRPVDYKVFYDRTPGTVDGGVRATASTFGVSPEEFRRVASAQGVDLEAIAEARRKGRTYDEVATAARERGVIGFLSPEEREAQFRRVYDDVEKAVRGEAPDTIELKRAKADKGFGPAGALGGYVAAGTQAELPEVTKPGEHGYTVATLLIDALKDDAQASKVYDLYGRSLATGNTQKYIETRTEDLKRRAGISASQPDAVEKVAKLRRQAINEVIAYKTVGQWTPAVTLGDIAVTEGREAPSFLGALKPNVEIIGFNNKRQAIFRQESPLGVLFRVIDIPQAAVSGVLMGQGATTGIQTGANFFEAALETTEGASPYVRYPVASLGMAASVLAPDMLLVGGKAGKVARLAIDTARIRKIAPQVTDLLSTIAKSRAAQDFAAAKKAEIELRDLAPAVADQLDRYDASAAELMKLVDPTTDTAREDLTAIIGARIKAAEQEAAGRVWLHPSQRREVLEAKGKTKNTALADYDELFSTDKLLGRVAAARVAHEQSFPKTMAQYISNYAVGTTRDVLAPLAKATGLSAENIDRLSDIVRSVAPTALLSEAKFREQLQAALKADDTFKQDAFKGVRKALHVPGKGSLPNRLARKIKDIGSQTIDDLRQADLALLDRAAAAIEKNNEARAFAAAALMDEVASKGKLRVQPVNLFDDVAVLDKAGQPVRLSAAGQVFLKQLRRLMPDQDFTEAYRLAAVQDQIILSQAKRHGVDPFSLYKQKFPQFMRASEEDLKRFGISKKVVPPTPTAPASPHGKKALKWSPKLGGPKVDVETVEAAKRYLLDARAGRYSSDAFATFARADGTVGSYVLVFGDVRIVADSPLDGDDFNIIVKVGTETVEKPSVAANPMQALLFGVQEADPLMAARVQKGAPAIEGVPEKLLLRNYKAPETVAEGIEGATVDVPIVTELNALVDEADRIVRRYDEAAGTTLRDRVRIAIDAQVQRVLNGNETMEMLRDTINQMAERLAELRAQKVNRQAFGVLPPGAQRLPPVGTEAARIREVLKADPYASMDDLRDAFPMVDPTSLAKLRGEAQAPIIQRVKALSDDELERSLDIAEDALDGVENALQTGRMTADDAARVRRQINGYVEFIERELETRTVVSSREVTAPVAAREVTETGLRPEREVTERITPKPAAVEEVVEAPAPKVATPAEEAARALVTKGEVSDLDAPLVVSHRTSSEALDVSQLDPLAERASRQSKRGRAPKVGLYTYGPEVTDAEASQYGARKIDIELPPGTKMLDVTGLEGGTSARISRAEAEALLAEGVQVIRGKDVIGPTEYVILDRRLLERSAPTTAVPPTPAPIAAAVEAQPEAAKIVEVPAAEAPVPVATPKAAAKPAPKKPAADLSPNEAMARVSTAQTEAEKVKEAYLATQERRAAGAPDPREADLRKLFDNAIARAEGYRKMAGFGGGINPLDEVVSGGVSAQKLDDLEIEAAQLRATLLSTPPVPVAAPPPVPKRKAAGPAPGGKTWIEFFRQAIKPEKPSDALRAVSQRVLAATDDPDYARSYATREATARLTGKTPEQILDAPPAEREALLQQLDVDGGVTEDDLIMHAAPSMFVDVTPKEALELGGFPKGTKPEDITPEVLDSLIDRVAEIAAQVGGGSALEPRLREMGGGSVESLADVRYNAKELQDRIVPMDKDEALAFVRKTHSKLPDPRPQGLLEAYGVAAGGDVRVVGLLNTPSGPFADADGVVELSRVASDGKLKNGSSAVTYWAMQNLQRYNRSGDPAKARLVTTSLLTEPGEVYKALEPEGLRPTSLVTPSEGTGSRAGAKGTAQKGEWKINWEFGPAAAPEAPHLYHLQPVYRDVVMNGEKLSVKRLNSLIQRPGTDLVDAYRDAARVLGVSLEDEPALVAARQAHLAMPGEQQLMADDLRHMLLEKFNSKAVADADRKEQAKLRLKAASAAPAAPPAAPTAAPTAAPPSRATMSSKLTNVRDPEMTALAQAVMEGRATREQYEAFVNARRPISPFAQVPTPATDEKIRSALDVDQKDQVGAARALAEGTPVGLRLDIPALQRHNTPVVTIHEARTSRSATSEAGKVIGYDNVAVVRNAEFVVPQRMSIKIATGAKTKKPYATVEGLWVPTTPEQAVARAREVFNDPQWIQVGQDPFRHSYFYDRTTTQPVVAAEEVIQIGSLLFAKNPTYAPKEKFLYSIEPLARTAPSPWAEVPKRFIVAAETRLRKAGEDLDAGRINVVDYDVLVGDVKRDLATQKADRAARKAAAPLERGASVVRARLLEAQAAGVIDEAGVDLADWLIRQNPRIADDLNVSILTPASAKKRFKVDVGESVAGFYEPLERVVALIKERGSEETAVHEILHHTEQMLPETLQTAVRDEWAKQLSKALRGATPEQRPALEKALTGQSTALLQGVVDGTLPRSFYQFVNPSEFWAVNASRIVSGRYTTASKGLVAKAKQWLTEFVQKVKSAFGLSSDAPLIRGLDAVLKGEGTPVSNMLAEGDVFRSVEPTVAAAEEVTEVMPPPSVFFKTVSPTGAVTGITEFLDDGRSIVYLMEGADASTVLDGMARVLRRNVVDVKDMDDVVAWLKTRGVTVGHQFGEFVGDPAEVQKAEDFFAKAFVQYALEGISPSSALTDAFSGLKSTVANIYKVANDPVIGVPLQPQVRQVFDRVFADVMEQGGATLKQVLRRELVGEAEDEINIIDILSREAVRRGLSKAQTADLQKKFDDVVNATHARGERVSEATTVLDFPVPVMGKSTWTVGDLAEAQARRELKAQTERAAETGVDLDLLGRGRGKAGRIREETPVEFIRQALAPVEDEPALKAEVRSGLRMLASTFIGGDVALEKGVRELTPELRKAFDTGERVIEQHIGDAIAMLNDAVVRGSNKELLRYLAGSVDVRKADGRPIISAGHDAMGAVLDMYRRSFASMDPALRTALTQLADAINSPNRGQAVANLGFDPTSGKPFAGVPAEMQATRDTAVKALDKILGLAEGTEDEAIGPALSKALRTAVDMPGSYRPSHEMRLAEVVTYLSGLTARPTAKGPRLFTGTSEQAAEILLKEVGGIYGSEEVSRRIAILVASFGSAQLGKDALMRMGLGINAKTREALVNWSVGKQPGVENINALSFTVSRYGADLDFVRDAVLDVDMYIPRMARDRMAKALARANYRPAGTTTAEDGFNVLYRYMKTRMTRGSFFIRQRYYMMNTVDHFTQISLQAGFGAGATSLARVLAQDLMVLPFWQQAYEAVRMLPFGKKLDPTFLERVRSGMTAKGDVWARRVGEWLSITKYHIEVNPILEGVDGGFRAGGKVYSYKTIRNIAVEEGVFASMATRELQSAIQREGTMFANAARDSISSASGKGAIVNFLADWQKTVEDTAEAWGERERLGAMVTLMEMGHDPRMAARITVDALYDYSQSMTKMDRHLLVGVLFPFWAFQKNANQQVVNLIFSPWGAYRMMCIRRARERSADMLAEVLYNDVGGDYGLDVKSMPPELQDSYYAIVKAFEDSYGGEPPADAKRALRMLMQGRALTVEDGKFVELNSELQRLRTAGGFADLQRFADYTVMRPSKAERTGYLRERTGFAVPFPRTEAVRMYYRMAGDDHSYMEVFYPESVVEAGLKHITQIAATQLLIASYGADLLPGIDLKSQGLREVSPFRVAAPVADITRSPIIAPLLAGTVEDLSAPKKVSKVFAAGAEGLVAVHPWIGQQLDEAFGTTFLRVPAIMDPLVRDPSQLSEEDIERIRELQKQYPDASTVRDQRYYIPAGVWAVAFENSPIGELNQMLLRYEANPLERTDDRGEMLRWARGVAGVDVEMTSASRAAKYEEPTKLKETKGI